MSLPLAACRVTNAQFIEHRIGESVYRVIAPADVVVGADKVGREVQRAGGDKNAVEVDPAEGAIQRGRQVDPLIQRQRGRRLDGRRAVVIRIDAEDRKTSSAGA